jgi:putative transposase
VGWTYYVLFFIHLDTRRVSIAGITEHPDSAWMEQMGRNVTLEGWRFLQDRRYLRMDRKLELLELAVIRNQGQARDNE